MRQQINKAVIGQIKGVLTAMDTVRIDGRSKVICLCECGRIIGESRALILQRLKLGLPIEEVLKPAYKAKLVTIENKTHTLEEWCKLLSISRRAVSHRMDKWKCSVQTALTTPKQKRSITICY